MIEHHSYGSYKDGINQLQRLLDSVVDNPIKLTSPDPLCDLNIQKFKCNILKE